MLSKFFIQRPVLANVIALLMVLLGAIAFTLLPVSQYPDVVPPTIQISAMYPGASAHTVMETVGLPVEQQINGVPGMLYMQSTSSSNGTYTLTVTFKLGTDPDQDAILVQNRLDAAKAQLPAPVQNHGITVKKKSTSILEFITLTSNDPQYNSLYMANYARIHLQDELARVDGVGDVNIFGSGTYAMRIWLDPDKIAARGLTPANVVSAIKAQSQNVASGQLGMPPSDTDQGFQYSLNIAGSLKQVPEFENIIVKSATSAGGQLVRLKDVGRVELGANTYGQIFRLNGVQTAALAISQLPEANALDVANRVAEKMQTLATSFPQGMHYSVPFNTTEFVHAAAGEVYKTLTEACILVLIIILLFLQDWRATLVPLTTIPVTLAGTFVVMSLMGFTLNMSTLFALVLAIGIIIDDAIVIVEGAAQYIDQGENRVQAAILAMKDLMGPVIGITLVLMVIFIPAAFLEGLTGKLYAQFALVIAATAFISAINAITLKPTQAALWMRPGKPLEQRAVIFRWFEQELTRVSHGYSRILTRAMRYPKILVTVGLLLTGLAILGLTKIPGGFLPLEDQGFLVVSVSLPDGASSGRTDKTLERVNKLAHQVAGVDNVVTVAGVSLLDGNAPLSSAGLAYVVLRPWDQRSKAEGLLPTYLALRKKLSHLPDGKAMVVPPPSIQGIGNVGGFTMRVELRDGSFDFEKLNRAANAIARTAAEQPVMPHVRMTSDFSSPQYDVDVDRLKASTFGVSLDDIFTTLSSYMGSVFVNNITLFGHIFPVYVQADSQHRLTEQDVDKLKVRNNLGDMVPLSEFVHLHQTTSPSLITLYNMYPSASVIGQNSTKLSSGQIMQRMDQVAQQVLPKSMGYEWTAMSYQEKVAGNQIYFIFVLAIILVYFILAAQYESWFEPLAVILTVPLALLGTSGTLLALGIPNTLYTQIGLILLIALAAKNAILIVEYARSLYRQDGVSITDAATQAAQMRLRPILMTSLAFILGMMPLVFASGAGANASKSIGISVVSGMTLSTILCLFAVPAFFIIVKRIEEQLVGKNNDLHH